MKTTRIFLCGGRFYQSEVFDSRDTYRFLFLRQREVRYKRRNECHMIEKEA